MSDTASTFPAQVSLRPAVNPWLVAIAVMFGTFMEVLDTTVVNVSLPHIAGSLSSTINETTWALTSYLVANAIILPITGWLANFFGRKRLLMISVVGFTCASFFCGLAPTLGSLVFFRILQGMFGGALQPISQAVLLEAFPPEQRGRAMGFWGLGIVVAPILGPVVGGWLTENYSWRWVFYINIPVGIASILMTKMFIFDPPYIKRGTSRIDYWGIGMLALGIGSLQFVLDKGQQDDWLSSPFITALLLIALGMLAMFVVYELMIDAPVVNLRAFKDRTFATGTGLMTVLGFVLYGSLVLLPIWLQTLLGYPSIQAGITLAPRGIGSFLAMPIVGALLSKFDPRKFLASGLIIASLTLWGFSQLNLQAGYWDFFLLQFTQGMSLAFLFVPLTTISMGSIPREHMGNATSIFNVLRNLGASMGIAASTAMVERLQQVHSTVLVEHITPYNAHAMARKAGIQHALQSHGVPPTTAAKASYVAMFSLVERQAAMLAFLDVFRWLAIIFICMVPLVLLMKKPRKSPGPTAAH